MPSPGFRITWNMHSIIILQQHILNKKVIPEANLKASAHGYCLCRYCYDEIQSVLTWLQWDTVCSDVATTRNCLCFHCYYEILSVLTLLGWDSRMHSVTKILLTTTSKLRKFNNKIIIQNNIKITKIHCLCNLTSQPAFYRVLADAKCIKFNPCAQ